jgi:hypothetical protein
MRFPESKNCLFSDFVWEPPVYQSKYSLTENPLSICGLIVLLGTQTKSAMSEPVLEYGIILRKRYEPI